MTTYDHTTIEAKWQKRWEEAKLYKAPQRPKSDKKRYILDMFPYPSGAGMHVGHVEGYTATDIYARYSRMKGFEVLHPIGWDAFGLPAENYAIKNGIHPDKSTHDNIANFIKQLKAVGLSYDWDREIDTSSPEYYKWTQWLFIQLFNKGLAYKKTAATNWCPSCETVLANEQVVDGVCERCDTQVVEKDLDQWFFKITEYADRLLEGHDRIDWPESTKTMQRNWIGRKEGMKIHFDDIEVFTTRPDTLAGATFIAVAANFGPADEGKTKVGEFTGRYVTNPLTQQKIPVWKANYVSADYGSGAIMGVPAHDERDREFALKYKIDIVEMEPDPNLWEKVIQNKWGERTVNYRLRDWLISRQRYWGAPIPMTLCSKCGWQPVPEDQLPVLLPTDVEFTPKGESPLAKSVSFQKGVTCAKCGGPARREVDTMDTFMDSSWYFLRFCDPRNSQAPWGKEAVDAWMPVDLYVGGDHATTHLIYARFFQKVFYDLGLTKVDEPFSRFFKNGHVAGEDGRKMSKRWGNVVNPLDVVAKFGADTLRLYEMFMGPLDAGKVWNTAGVEGVSRFLGRVWRLFQQTHAHSTDTLDPQLDQASHKLILKVEADINSLSLNTAVSTMMETINLGYARASLPHNWQQFWQIFLKVLAPFAPHLAEELWELLGEGFSVHQSAWPEANAEKTLGDSVVVVVQVNGKMRETLKLDTSKSKDEQTVSQLALASAKVASYINNQQYRTIFVPGKLVNFVIQ